MGEQTVPDDIALLKELRTLAEETPGDSALVTELTALVTALVSLTQALTVLATEIHEGKR